MISSTTRKQMAQCLIQLAAIEDQSEAIRQRICSIDTFEPHTLFAYLTHDACLTMEQLKEFTISQGRTVRIQGLIGVILAHDSDFDGALQYYEQQCKQQNISFLRMVLTVEDLNLRQMVALRERQNNIDPHIADLFSQLLVVESESYLKLQLLKQQLHKCYDFDVYDCFRVIDNKNRGYIDYDQLRRFIIQSIEMHITDTTIDGPIQQAVIRIIRRLNKQELGDQVRYDAFAKMFKSQTNYIEQYSPRRLEKQKTEQIYAKKMYNIYGKIIKTETPTPSRKLATTPSRKKDTLNMSVMSQCSNNAFTTPKKSHRMKTQQSRSPIGRSPMGENISTPVRRTNMKSVTKQTQQFNRSVDRSVFLPLRHSPMVVSKNPKVKQHGRAISYLR